MEPDFSDNVQSCRFDSQMKNSDSEEVDPEFNSVCRESDSVSSGSVAHEPDRRDDHYNSEETNCDVSLFEMPLEPLMTVPVKLPGGDGCALVDTGAAVCLIKRSFVQDEDMYKQGSSCVVVGLGGRLLHPLGEVDIKFQLGAVQLQTRFVVVDDQDVQHDLLLGLTFLRQFKVRVNMVKNFISGSSDGGYWEIYFRTDEVQTVFREMPIFVQHDVQLLLGEPTIVQVQVGKTLASVLDDHDFYYNGHVLDKKKQPSHYLSGEKGILQLASGCSRILVEDNRCGRNQNATLKAGVQVGTISSLVDLEDLGVNVNFVQLEESPWTEDSVRSQINLSVLDEQQADKVLSLLLDKSEVLSQGEHDVGCAGVTQHKIELHDSTPIRQRPRRFPEPVAQEIERQCALLKEMDIISYSKSAWSSPVVPIRKKDGTIRMCIDYRQLNDQTVADRHPLPNMNDLVFGLHGTRFFTTLDLVKGYYQVPLHPDSRACTAFSTTKNHYEFNRLSFGLKNAPGAFQREMQAVLSNFDDKQVVVYIDDILIMSKTFEEHLHLVSQVLGTLREYSMKINLAKCNWFQEEVKYLGHLVSRQGLTKSDEYMDAVKSFRKPVTVKHMRSFLGLVNFQRKFVANCSSLCKPLSSQLRGPDKRKIEWTDEMDLSFDHLREAISEAVQLAYPDYTPGAPWLKLCTDASGVGAGACLSQEQEGVPRVIAYASMTFSDTQRQYSTIERELAAIRWAVKAFRCFLYGVQFTLVTDHRPLVYMSSMSRQNARIMRTMNELEEYDFKIEYIPGKENVSADALSRVNDGGGEREEDNLARALECASEEELLPPGLTLCNPVKGGGDSMIESLVVVLREHCRTNKISVKRPKDGTEMRQCLVDEQMKRIQNDPNKDRGRKAKLQLMRFPGQLVGELLLPAFCDLFRVEVWVHHGMTRPVIHRGTHKFISKESFSRVHLQCLAGVHYNPLVEGTYEPPVAEQVECLEMSDLCIDEVDVNTASDFEYDVSPFNNVLSCGHDCYAAATRTAVQVGSLYYCALIDTGAQISLISEKMWNGLPETVQTRAQFRAGCAQIRSVGSMTRTIGVVDVELTLMHCVIPEPVRFAIVPDAGLPYCLVLGADFIKRWNVSINYNLNSFELSVSQEIYSFPLLMARKVDVVTTTEVALCLAQEEITIDNDGQIQNSPCALLTTDQLYLAQHGNYAVRSLYRRVLEKVPPTTWRSPCLARFVSYASRLRVQEDLLWCQVGDRLRPVVPFSVLVEVSLQIHWQMGHMGRNKLINTLQAMVWHPSISEVATDICASCPVCQRFKVSTQTRVPPMLKVETAAPFDLVAVDLVLWPRTRSGYIGCLVVVDHFSKWVACAPIKDKKAATIARILEYQILPSLVAKPKRILSDNGVEFTASVFEDVLNRFGIVHVRSTPYKPSSNGAVERVNRTLSELIRYRRGEPDEWDKCLTHVVMSYNHGWHSQLRMSPSQCLLEQSHPERVGSVIKSETKQLWKEGHPCFASFRVGDLVLKKIKLSGHETLNKLAARFDGPYKITAVHDNGVTYTVETITNDREGRVIPVHHSQIKRWVLPPKYLTTHVRYTDLVPEYSSSAPDAFFRDVEPIHGVNDFRERVLRSDTQKKYSSSETSESDEITTMSSKPGMLMPDLELSIDVTAPEFGVSAEDIGELSSECSFSEESFGSFEGFEEPSASSELPSDSVAENSVGSVRLMGNVVEKPNSSRTQRLEKVIEECNGVKKQMLKGEIVIQRDREWHSTPVGLTEKLRSFVQLSPIAMEGEVVGKEEKSAMSLLSQVSVHNQNVLLEEVEEILKSQEMELERLEQTFERDLTGNNFSGFRSLSVNRVKKPVPEIGTNDNEVLVHEKLLEIETDPKLQRRQLGCQSEVSEVHITNQSDTFEDASCQFVSHNFNFPSPHLQELGTEERRSSLSPIKNNIKEARSIIAECRRRSRARILSACRDRLEDLPSTEASNVDSPRRKALGLAVRRCQTRSMGPVAEVDRVLQHTIEYDLRKGRID